MVTHPVLAIDYGAKRIGLAATDDFGLSTHPAGTLANDDDLLADLVTTITKRQIKTVVIGLPLHLNGNEGQSAKKARDFGDQLRAQLPEIPITFYDERFTTLTASEKLREGGRNAKRQKAVIDQAAAMEILRDFLNW